MRTTVALLLAALAVPALAQSSDPMIFVANNGNLEGSVSAMRVNADGTLTLVDRLVTGSRTSTALACAGCNSYAISLSPNGRYLATVHAAGQFPENYIVYEVDPDGTLSQVADDTLPQAGLAVDWIRDDLLAASITNFGGVNELLLYKWNPSAGTFLVVDTQPAGGFFTSIAVHPSGQWIVTNDSAQNVFRLFEIIGDTANLVTTVPIPLFGTAVEFSPDGQYLFASGGISLGGRAFAGYKFDTADQSFTPVPGSPFTSPGQSPKGFAFSTDGELMFVSHGTDATIRVFGIDPATGQATSLGQTFDVGLQGTLQGMDTLDGLLFALDNSTAIDGIQGAYSFAIDGSSGAITPLPGAPVLTGGIGPNDVVAWAGSSCTGDIADDFGTAGSDGQVSFGDFLALLGLIGPCPGGTPGCVGDIADDFGTMGADGQVSFGDFLALLGLIGPCP
jgi:6-phosphogluconolactonase (cycloisomerase 2 family)